MVIAYSPHRISYCGGGTDFPEFYEKHGGAVISCAIDQYHRLGNDDYNGLCSGSDVQRGSGLGGSGSFHVNFLNFHNHMNGMNPRTPQYLAEQAYNLERHLLDQSVGKQDHYASAVGGFTWLNFRASSPPETYTYPESLVKPILEKTLLFFLGQTRNASARLFKLQHGIKDGSLELILTQIKQLTIELHHTITNSEYDQIGRILNDACILKMNGYPDASNLLIKAAIVEAKMKGAEAAKVTGAGGGGHLLVYAEKDTHRKIIGAMKKLNISHVPFKMSRGAWVEK